MMIVLIVMLLVIKRSSAPGLLKSISTIGHLMNSEELLCFPPWRISVEAVCTLRPPPRDLRLSKSVDDADCCPDMAYAVATPRKHRLLLQEEEGPQTAGGTT